MPQYYFDVIECGDPLTDANGTVLPDFAAAREYAFKGLTHVAKHHCRDEPFCDFRMKVRDELGKTVLIVSLQVQEGERVEPHDAERPRELEVGSWV